MDPQDRETLIRVEERTRSMDEKLTLLISQITGHSIELRKNALDIASTRRDFKWAGGIFMALWSIVMAWLQGWFAK